MSEIIKLGDQFYVLATSALAEERTRVLKEGETFAVFDRYGDVRPIGRGEQGLFHEGTRFLSRLEVLMGRRRPLLLASTVRGDNVMMTADLMNPDFALPGGAIVPRGSVHLFRQKFLWKGTCHERLRLVNHGTDTVELDLYVYFEPDFADIFEVRGMKRTRRGVRLPAEISEGRVTLAYDGVDGVRRALHAACEPLPSGGGENFFHYQVVLERKGQKEFTFRWSCEVDGAVGGVIGGEGAAFALASSEAGKTAIIEQSRDCRITTSNKQFGDLLERSLADLHMLVTGTPHGPYPYAGVPWFSTVFGRDGLITAMEVLWVNQDITRGVLGYLAETQSDADDPSRDAEPGKIIHEFRHGEMAAAGEIPFGRYYGSADATLLFVVLAWRYYRQTADRAFIEGIWPNILRALEWMEKYGDMDGDGFIEYSRRSPAGLINQGWKDSGDSVMHADGTQAEGPVALCEVQGYAYAAMRGAAELAALMGDPALAERMRARSTELRRNFERAFWRPEIGCYAVALDGKKRPCAVRSSNAGHCLFSRIASPARAAKVVKTLMGEDMFSGWGIRTLSSKEALYNPMSYHNGSIWPHDNAIIAHGMRLYGHGDAACALLTSLFETSLHVDLRRLPELFCGFHRREGQSPTQYPVACSPQAWASGAVFMLLRACLGMTINAPRRQLRFNSPQLPEWLDSLRIEGLKVGAATVDLMLHRVEGDVSVNVIRRRGELEVLVVK